jgi:hypothetical protein
MSNPHPAPAPAGFEMIEVPNTLGAKAGNFRAKNVSHDRVDASIARLVRNYPEAVAEQRVALRDTWNRIKAGTGSDDDKRQFGSITHDFKGQAAIFGYPLVGRVAETLSLLSKMGAVANPKVQTVVEAHISAMEKILAARIEGDGGEIGAAIIDSLRAATKKASG